MKTFLIVDGNKAIKDYMKEFKKILKAYKNEFKGWGYTFKEVIPKGAKKPYYYWYKWEYNADSQNNVWTYIGKEKPNIDIPNPPISEISDINYTIIGDNIIITEEEYNKISNYFINYQKFEINPI